MGANIVTVKIPERLYRRLRTIAQGTNRAIAEVLIASAEAMLPLDSAETDLPPEVADELAAMRLFSDQALWNATQPSLSSKQQARLSKLSQQQLEGSLSSSEQEELNRLLAEYDRSVLRRAQAFALLSLRGHKLPDLNAT